MTRIVGFLFGLIVGSFLNVLIVRYSEGGSALRGRSRCPACRHPLAWWELVPLVSYLALRGRCAHCHRPIRLHYPLIELGAAVGTASIVARVRSPLEGVAYLILLWTALVILAIDLRQMVIPDRATLALLGGAVVAHLSQRTLGSNLSSWVLGGLLMGGVPLLIVVLSRGRGMGWGDVKLGAVLGFLLGFPVAAAGLLASILAGAFVGGLLVLTRLRAFRDAIPFGPFLLLGAFLAMLWGQPLIAWYLGYGGW